MPDPFSLEGKTILVTGSSAGIGASVAAHCAEEGAKVVVTGRNAERLAAVRDGLKGDGHVSVIADLNDVEQRNVLADTAPTLDGVVLNSGVFPGLVPFNFVDDQKFSDVISTNFLSPVAFLKRLVAKKKLANGASVVFVTSSAVMLGPGASAAYTASKGALNSGSRSIAADVAKRKIRVNNVAFGYVTTELTKATVPEEQLNRTPLGVPGPDDVVGSILFLLSGASSWMTRSTLIVDGGISLKVGHGY